MASEPNVVVGVNLTITLLFLDASSEREHPLIIYYVNVQVTLELKHFHS